MKYRFIEEQSRYHRIGLLCKVLQVRSGTYYAWKRRGKSNRAKQDEIMKEMIEEIFNRHRSRYGSPRVHAEIKAMGVKIARKRVARLMQEQGLRAKRRRRSSSL